MEEFKVNQENSGINRIVGVDEDLEKELLKYFERVFENNSTDGEEIIKPAELENIIARINSVLVDFLGRYGINAINIPSKNIHVIDRTKFDPVGLAKLQEKFKTDNGFFIALKQAIGILKEYKEDEKLSFLQTLIHEIMHFESFHSLEETDSEFSERNLENVDKRISLKTRRSGFSIASKDGEMMYFHYIDEVVITELAIRFEQQYFNGWPEVRDEINERNRYLERMSVRENIPLSRLMLGAASLRRKVDEDGNAKYVAITHSYNDDRIIFHQLLNQLFVKNKDTFDSEEQIFNLFAKATLTGKLLPVARLIEKTFGKGSFRIMGIKSSDKYSI